MPQQNRSTGDDAATRAERRALLAVIHLAAKQLGLDETTRRAQQQRLTGQASCASMNLGQLRQLAWALKDAGATIGVPGPPPRGGTGGDRPSRPQWQHLERLALARGWDFGLEDLRLAAFVQRTAGVERVRFLTRRQITDCISGLTRWARQEAARGDATDATPPRPCAPGSTPTGDAGD